MPFEHDDLGLRIIGYNTPIRFYDPTRTLRAEIFLQSNNTLNVGGLSGTGGTGGTGTTTAHGLGDMAIHTGVLADIQAPQFLKTDGTRSMTGALNMGAQAITNVGNVDGVDVSGHAARHHAGGADAMDHGSMAGLDGDDHPQYGALAQNEVVTGAWDFQATIDAYDILPAATDTYDLGSSTKLWRKGYLSELETVLFALNTVTISGARQVWGHNAGTLGAALTDSADTCDFGQVMTVGDFVEIRGLGAVEYFKVGTRVSGTTYRIGNSGSGARNLDGSGANAWPAGTPYLVLGASGDGRVEVNADGPKLQMLAQGATYNAATEYVRLGNMRNAFGVGANDYWGFGVGDYARGNYLKYDSNGGFVLTSGNGAVSIDTEGIKLNWGTAALNGVSWMDGATNRGYVMMYNDGTLGSMRFYLAGNLRMAFYEDTVKAVIRAGVGIGLDPLGIGSGDLWILNDVRVGKGLSVGSTATNPTDGDILTSGGIHIGGTADPGDDNLIVDGKVTIAGTAYIGDTANAKATLGLTINQGAADDEILALKSSDVAHGMTNITETDTFGFIKKAYGPGGGIDIVGLSENSYGGVVLRGYETFDNTTKSTSGLGHIVLDGAVKSGATVGACGTNANLAVIRNHTTTRFIFDAEGDAYADVQWTTFDDYDDVALLTDLERAMLAQRDPVKAGFVDFLQYNHDALEAAGIVHFDRENPGHAMVNTTKLSMALVGAIRQTNARMDALEARMLTG